MDLRLRGTLKENANIIKLLKQMCSLQCRVNFDTENGIISIDQMDDNNIETVIDDVQEVFDITNVDIIPTEKLPKVTEDSINFKKVEFTDSEVEEQLNKLARACYWAMYSVKAKPFDICQYLLTTATEISMKYNPKPVVKCEVGNIIDCNYGCHIKSEISGGHVHSIVCDINEDGMLYVLPITKVKINDEPSKCLLFNANIDVKYYYDKYDGGTVLYKMGRYVSPLRVNSVVGYALPEFFNQLLKSLPDTIDFSANLYKDDEDESILLPQNNSEETDGEITGEVSEGTVVEKSGNENSTKNPVESSTEESECKTTKKNISAEDCLTAIISNALNNLDKSKSVETQIDDFLKSIGFSRDEIIIESFVSACSVKKIGYESIIAKLQEEEFPNIRAEILKLTFKDAFKKWLVNYPDLKENHPKISFVTLLKVFAKKMV